MPQQYIVPDVASSYNIAGRAITGAGSAIGGMVDSYDKSEDEKKVKFGQLQAIQKKVDVNLSKMANDGVIDDKTKVELANQFKAQEGEDLPGFVARTTNLSKNLDMYYAAGGMNSGLDSSKVKFDSDPEAFKTSIVSQKDQNTKNTASQVTQNISDVQSGQFGKDVAAQNQVAIDKVSQDSQINNQMATPPTPQLGMPAGRLGAGGVTPSQPPPPAPAGTENPSSGASLQMPSPQQSAPSLAGRAPAPQPSATDLNAPIPGRTVDPTEASQAFAAKNVSEQGKPVVDALTDAKELASKEAQANESRRQRDELAAKKIALSEKLAAMDDKLAKAKIYMEQQKGNKEKADTELRQWTAELQKANGQYRAAAADFFTTPDALDQIKTTIDLIEAQINTRIPSGQAKFGELPAPAPAAGKTTPAPAQKSQTISGKTSSGKSFTVQRG